jgi:penicillin-binding protein 1B
LARSSRTYSPQRFRLVVLLLTLITLPIVVGTSALIYYYMKYATIVERRVSGERWMVPSRIYARPLELSPELPLTVQRLVKTLNGLKYQQRVEGQPQPGEFRLSEQTVVLQPREGPDSPGEPIEIRFDLDHVTTITGLNTGADYRSLSLEPELITYLFDESREKRRFVSYEELPENLIKAVLAIEDRRFFSHPGLDPFRIVGAAVRNIQADSYIQGGSTITQQLVKNFFLTPERTMKRKVQEALIAFVLERRADKTEILELYLNEIYLGQEGSFGINGMGQAARVYFEKDVGNLTLTESALLAGLIQSPNPYQPRRHPERAIARRNVVLGAMRDAGFVEPDVIEEAMSQPLRVEEASDDGGDAPYFVDLVKDQLTARYDPAALNTGNLSIYTSLDLHLQTLAMEALEKGLAEAEEKVKAKHDEPLQGALIALETRTGQIVAMVGGRSYGASQYNRATQAHRQPGSTFKPFVYLAAFEAVFEDPTMPPVTPATVVEDGPAVFFYGDKEYIPHNYTRRYQGPVTLRYALSRSLNIPTVKVAEMIGFEKVAQLWTDKLQMGDNVQPYPAVALGAFEATPLEMATAYNVIANYGLKVPPVTVNRVTDEQDRTLELHVPEAPQRVLHEESAYLVTSMLRTVMNEGTGAGARRRGFRGDAAGKTGTTNDTRDAWFIGFTPDLLCVVWVGFDDNTATNHDGASAALPIWTEFMTQALEGRDPGSFPVPESIVFIEIDKRTGLLATPSCPSDTVLEAFIPGTEPRERCYWQ